MKYQIYQGDLVVHKTFPPVEGIVIGGGLSKLIVQRDDGSVYQDDYNTWELVESPSNDIDDSSVINSDAIDVEFTIVDQ